MSGASLFCVSLSVAWAAYTISETAEIHLWRDPTERWILVLVLFAYVLAWLPVALLPYDIANNITGNCTNDPTVRGRWWTLLYLANLFTGYVANDYARSYIYSGAFTIQRKMAEGWHIMWTWYAWAGLATLPLLLLIAWNNQFSLSAWQVTYESIYAMANLYGILMFILLLAHALVELPKRLYHLSSIKVRSKLYYHELGAAASELEREHQEWEVECESVQRAERETGWREQWPGQSAQVLAERLKTDQKVMQLEADSLSAIASLGRSSSSKPPSTPPRGRHAAAAAAAAAAATAAAATAAAATEVYCRACGGGRRLEPEAPLAEALPLTEGAVGLVLELVGGVHGEGPTREARRLRTSASRPALRRPCLSAAEHAAGCPKPRSASANQPLGPAFMLSPRPHRPFSFHVARRHTPLCRCSCWTKKLWPLAIRGSGSRPKRRARATSGMHTW